MLIGKEKHAKYFFEASFGACSKVIQMNKIYKYAPSEPSSSVQLLRGEKAEKISDASIWWAKVNGHLVFSGVNGDSVAFVLCCPTNKTEGGMYQRTLFCFWATF